jgi:hypothetical protein
MNGAEENYTALNPKIKKAIDEWLPQLSKLNDARKPMRNLMIFLILIPFVLLTVLAILGVITWVVYIPIAMGSLAISFVYIGKLQSCYDKTVAIDAIVRLGYLEPILKCVENLSCYSKFESLIKDMGGILKYGK